MIHVYPTLSMAVPRAVKAQWKTRGQSRFPRRMLVAYLHLWRWRRGREVGPALREDRAESEHRAVGRGQEFGRKPVWITMSKINATGAQAPEATMAVRRWEYRPAEHLRGST
jgi:hypothetical protein